MIYWQDNSTALSLFLPVSVCSCSLALWPRREMMKSLCLGGMFSFSLTGVDCPFTSPKTILWQGLFWHYRCCVVWWREKRGDGPEVTDEGVCKGAAPATAGLSYRTWQNHLSLVLRNPLLNTGAADFAQFKKHKTIIKSWNGKRMKGWSKRD